MTKRNNTDHGQSKIARDLRDRRLYFQNNLAATEARWRSVETPNPDAQRLYDELMLERLAEVARIDRELARMGVVYELQ